MTDPDKEKPSADESKTTRYASGSLRSEHHFRNGLTHGLPREWHENGELARETPFIDGRIDGTVRQWDASGKLLGECILNNGTGVCRKWHQNGQLESELAFVDGAVSGRQVVMAEDGEKLAEQYWLDSRKVSRKKYEEACLQNPDLQRYPSSSRPERSTSRSGAAAPRSVGRNGTDDDLIATLLSNDDTRDALAWLKADGEASRSIGEATDSASSVRFVEALCASGALKVSAIKFDGPPDISKNCGSLVVELPMAKTKRRKLFELSARHAESMGFDPDKDHGQRFILLMMD